MIRTLAIIVTSGILCFLPGCQADTGGTQTHLGIDWAEPVEVATGPARQGPWRMNESEFHYVDDPAVALADGRIYMAWVDNQDQNVLFRIFDGNGEPMLDAAINVSASDGIFSWLPRVAVDGETVIVAWEEILFTGGSHGGEILLARSGDGGRSFSDPVNLSNTTAGAGKGRLTRQRWDNGSLDLVAEDGRVVVAWTEYEGALRATTSSDAGRDFGTPVHVAGDDELPARAPSLAAGPDGRIWLAWTVGEDTQADIRLAYSDDPAEGFTEARRIRPSGHHSDSPVVRVSSDGTVHLAWTRSDGGPFRASRIVHAMDSDGSGAFDQASTVSGEAPGAYPQMAVAGEHVLVTWEHGNGRAGRPFGIGYAVSTDGGNRFASAAEVPATMREEYGANGGNQGLLMRKLDADDQGRVALGHATFNRNEASHIWLLQGSFE